MARLKLDAFIVNAAYCKSCEICVAMCPKKLLGMKDRRPAISSESDCNVCRMCQWHCPDLAIQLEAHANE